MSESAEEANVRVERTCTYRREASQEVPLGGGYVDVTT